ncbi:uncharacterized protein LOC144488443 [Mustelus asterias]
MNMNKCDLFLFVSLVKMTLVSGNVQVMNGTYPCKEGNRNKLEIHTTWIRQPCNETSLLIGDLVIYSKREGFIPPILDHPTDNVFRVEGCPVIVSICHTYDREEIRITYTGVKVNTTPLRSTAVVYIVITLIAAACIGVICFVTWKRFKSKETPQLSAEKRNLTAIEGTESGTVSSSVSQSSLPDLIRYEN